MSERRVVITGLGIVSSLGNDVKTFWDNLLNGVSGIKTLSKYFDPEKEQLITKSVLKLYQLKATIILIKKC